MYGIKLRELERNFLYKKNSLRIGPRYYSCICMPGGTEKNQETSIQIAAVPNTFTHCVDYLVVIIAC
jgi:hypothetical protein